MICSYCQEDVPAERMTMARVRNTDVWRYTRLCKDCNCEATAKRLRRSRNRRVSADKLRDDIRRLRIHIAEKQAELERRLAE